MSDSIQRIIDGNQTKDDLEALRQLLTSGDSETISQLGKYNVNIKEGKDIHIGDRIYQQLDEEAIKAIVKAIQVNSGIHQNTQGGDAAARDIDKSNTTIFQFFFSGNEFKPPSQLSSIDLDLSDISEDTIRQAYEDSLPPYADDWRLSGNSISQQIYALEQFGKLPDFYNRLIQDENLPLEVRNRLQVIAKQLALKKSPEIPKNRSSPSSGEARSEQLKSYLIATIIPDDIDRDRFLLNAWLIIDDKFQDCSTFHLQDLSRFQSLIDEDEQQQGKLCRLPSIDRSESTKSQTSRLPQIDKELDCLLKKALKILRGKRYDLTIEIFLPSSLMYMDVDRWKIADSIADDVTLGIRYPIRLRSLERLNSNYLDVYHSGWQKCWNNVRVVLENESIQDIFEHLEDVESFNWKLLKIKLKEKIGLKVTCTHPKSMSTDLFKAILQATTPVAIWIRNDIPDLDRVTAIDEILTFRPLAHLCESVRQTRELADAQEAEHIGLHLAVLWENPYRLTPDVMVELKPAGY
jgi:vWA-MoxR associated protein C-terminal domain/Effector-associated domain 10